jgi:transcriptional regulator with XRE-family HTH domain
VDFSERIVALRKQHKMTQEKVGELVNMSQRSVANWESGERCPSIPTLIELSNKFNVSVDYMLGCSDVPEKAKEQPAIQDSRLLTKVISRIQDLPDPALSRVSDFLDGLQAGREVAATQAAAPDPEGAPAE